MSDEAKKDYMPLLPFDVTFGDHFIIYDSSDYQADTTLCNKENVRMYSGNIYKFFTYSLNDPYKVGGD